MNVIFIIVDTLRKDYARPLESKLKRLGFITYENTIAPATWTVPSHASIFTGLYPALHKAHETRENKGFGIKLKHGDVLSRILLDKDYDTYLLTANPYIRPSLGFRGFNHFYETSGWSPPRFSLLSYDDNVLLTDLRLRYGINDRRSLIKLLLFNYPFLLIKGGLSKIVSPLNKLYSEIASRAKNWPLDKGATHFARLLDNLEFNRNSPNFIFMNLMEVHEPYFIGDTVSEVPKNLMTGYLDPDYVAKWRDMYPKEAEYVSQKIIEMLGILKEKGIFDNSLVVVTGDHGQLLGEHNRIGHGVSLYDELLKVPLLIKYPKGSQIETTQVNGKYISLTSLKPFILNFIESKLDDDSSLYSDVVFAESYGIGGITVNPKTEKEKKNIKQLEKYRIAIYYKNFKGIFNVTDWKFEEIISYDPSMEVTEDIVKHMKKEVIKFLKTATIAKVPKIKL